MQGVHTALAVAGLLIGFAGAVAEGGTYQGELAGPSIVGSGQWENGVSINWKVCSTTLPGVWLYEYALVAPAKDVSHFILGISPGVEAHELRNFEWSVDGMQWKTHALDEDSVRLHVRRQGNPELPGDLYGLKFDLPIDSTVVLFRFEYDHAPNWGDFYAKSGTGVQLWNTGFAAGSLAEAPGGFGLENPVGTGKLMVPDVLPEPATAAVLLVGGIVVMWRRRLPGASS